MASPGSASFSKPQPIPIDARAADISVISARRWKSAAEFTAVPGWGGVAMESRRWLPRSCSRQVTPRAWLTVWLIEAFVAVALQLHAATKAHRAKLRALSPVPGRKFVLSFCSAIVAGGPVDFRSFRRAC